MICKLPSASHTLLGDGSSMNREKPDSVAQKMWPVEKLLGGAHLSVSGWAESGVVLPWQAAVKWLKY